MRDLWLYLTTMLAATAFVIAGGIGIGVGLGEVAPPWAAAVAVAVFLIAMLPLLVLLAVWLTER